MHYLLKIREEIKKLASGHISHRAALRLEKSALFCDFSKKVVENAPSRPAALKPDTHQARPPFSLGSFASRLRRE
jgi:hypothetical protein